ncbi:MAG: tRNA preQ1(34) S-adenosylmethionine ribosyltransferase-isomerase QueA [Deltaproteobacteria bacterium]|nr:tRNA preQ1(34) S-adenosylmethionine ribosyltransferase-isomerase QueA [Deltaproteobacteria bacterium]MBI3755029.1 tRNA preQ1(34) S-adenosylmethionine ribosyltransferase-isomerase QueA [Deltaproteobacteria bacterium]
MKLEDFNYPLTKELIAQFPCKKRDESRLMILHKKNGAIEHRTFFELTEYLKAGDVLVLNNTKVIPARLFGRKTTGGIVEVLLLQKSEVISRRSEVWNCLINPARGLKKGSEIAFEHGLRATVIEKKADGNWIVELHTDRDIDDAIENIGKMPLPPYIKREMGDNAAAMIDSERYQTVFAKNKGAIAAPTGGLHFTNELLKKIRELGAEIFYITLHTGLGTFKPVKADNIIEHKMEPEYYNIDPAVFEAIKYAKMEKRRIVAVGSTATRALETMVNPPSPPFAKGGMGGFGWEMPILSGTTDLFIYPGYRFNAVDALITNFHLPKSTLLMLVAAFAGRDSIMEAYKEAVRHGYRFFSYGDAMLIV